jgi:uncharacterized membrane protein YphA (DoxX/SURF4 family)
MKTGPGYVSLTSRMLDENTAVLLARYALGVVLVIAGTSKLINAERLRAALAEAYGVTSEGLIRGIGAVLPPVEVLLGALLLLGIRVDIALPAAIALLFLLTTAIVVRMKDGTDCGCGIASMGRTRSSIVARNVAFMLVAAPAILGGPAAASGGTGFDLAPEGVLLLLVVPLAFVSVRGHARVSAPVVLTRRNLLRLALTSALVLVPGLYSARRAEAACYGCKTCSPQSVLYSCNGGCCIFLVRDREYCDTGCSPCSPWRQEVYC